MTDLAGLHSAFQDYLRGSSEALALQVRDDHERLEIYRRGYAVRLVEALANDFPGLQGLLGAAEFADMARRYVAAHPSRHASLRWLGRALPGYLERQMVPLHPLAADMARFDWAVALAFDARDQSIAGLVDLLALPPVAWESFSLIFADSVSTFAADAALGDLRQAVLRDAADLPSMAGVQASWAVWRQGEEVRYRALAKDEAAVFRLMQSGATFGEMCRLTGELGAVDAALRSAEMLKDWLERGLVAAIEPGPGISIS